MGRVVARILARISAHGPAGAADLAAAQIAAVAFARDQAITAAIAAALRPIANRSVARAQDGDEEKRPRKQQAKPRSTEVPWR